MRIKTYDGSIVRLRHFRYDAKHVELLKLIILQLPNLDLFVEGKEKPIKAFHINIESQFHLRTLNPEPGG